MTAAVMMAAAAVAAGAVGVPSSSRCLRLPRFLVRGVRALCACLFFAIDNGSHTEEEDMPAVDPVSADLDEWAAAGAAAAVGPLRCCWRSCCVMGLAGRAAGGGDGGADDAEVEAVRAAGRGTA